MRLLLGRVSYMKAGGMGRDEMEGMGRKQMEGLKLRDRKIRFHSKETTN